MVNHKAYRPSFEESSIYKTKHFFEISESETLPSYVDKIPQIICPGTAYYNSLAKYMPFSPEPKP